MRFRFHAAAIVATVLLTLAPSARADITSSTTSWTQLPGLNAAAGAQWVRAIAYGTPPNVVYAGLEGGGVFRSETGGATWSAFNSGFPNPLTTNVRALLASSTGTTGYAGIDSGIWKSEGGGAWQPMAQGPEDDPANPKKLNESVQSLVSLTGGSTMLAGVFSGGVFKSGDGGATWSPPPANSGMPVSETIYGLTENIPGLVYATGASGVYVSTNQGSTWTRVSDGIPGGASPITTWAYPQRPQILFTSTGSNGIYRSVNAGITWSEINNGLLAVRARGLQIFTASQGAHVYAATENALWESLTSNAVDPPPPNWHKVTTSGLATAEATNEIMWSLSSPVIPGSGGLGLIAGTQSDGGFFISFAPPDSNCTAGSHTTYTSPCPRLNDGDGVDDQAVAQVGKTLTALVGTWTGTPIIEFEYQWEKCSAPNSGCSSIADAQESSYLIPNGGDGFSYRVKITATNPAPTFGTVFRYSGPSALATPPASAAPGYNQICGPSISVVAPGSTTSPEVGDTMTADDGSCSTSKLDPNNGWFNPEATAVTYRWLRCENGSSDCNEITGATSRNYVLQAADGDRFLKVRVTGSASGFSTPVESGASYYVISSPAAIADPIPNPDGGEPLSQAPSLQGEAYVGETIVGNVGGWKDPTTDFVKRWVRCDADGSACSSSIYKVATTDPEDGSTYTIRPEDVGYTLRFRVLADVNNDLTPDEIDNHLPQAVEVDTPQSAVVSYRPVPPPPAATPTATATPGPGGGGSTSPDTIAPTLQALLIGTTKVVAGKGTTFTLRLSEAGTVKVLITRATRGRKVGKKCVKTTRKNRRRKACTYQKRITTITRTGQPAGTVKIKFTGKVRGKKLPRGTYTAKVTITDAAGNVSKAKTLVFRIVRR